MKLDLRDIPIVTLETVKGFLVMLDGLVRDRVVAFDTDEGWIEVLAGSGDTLIPLAHLSESLRAKYGDYRGLATSKFNGKVEVFVQVR